MKGISHIHVFLLLTLLPIMMLPSPSPAEEKGFPACQTERREYFPEVGVSPGHIGFFVEAKVCGTATGLGDFETTLHEVNSGTIGGEGELAAYSYEYRFFGLRNLTQLYSYTKETTALHQWPQNSSAFPDNDIDFALTYARLTILDTWRNVFHTAEATAFIGFKEYFEVDWADFNNDGTVSIVDISDIAYFHGQVNAYWDFNGNATVDDEDVDRASSHFDRQWPITPYPSQGLAGKSLSRRWQTSCTLFPEPNRSYCSQRAVS